MTKPEAKLLMNWYLENHRDLPWRRTRDAYEIWISETMLQQTTSRAVLKYYGRFLARFPTVSDLALATIEDVYSLWSGLGYYSRARNLHRAAQEIHRLGHFPNRSGELTKLPGFGPYTSRAVGSLAFNEAVGVLDGNVIRVLCRKNNFRIKWWQPKEKQKLQKLADELSQNVPSSSIWNQSLMELGSQICTPKSPKCSLCPWLKSCKAFKRKTQNQIPLAKPKQKGEILFWQPHIQIFKGKVRLIQNNYAPFLKNAWILPGQIQTLSQKPDFKCLRHQITRYDIFIKSRMTKIKAKNEGRQNEIWVEPDKIKRLAPYSIIQKVINENQNSIS